ncbi:MAG: deoxyguanosinetriphosphate triphosphohydrolase [Deltaproteobacteria bacterium]|nr:deoxyguanosinetriphosphate triphosphohydrolase [Deltaproteobacteria bacterium]MCL5277585.1 deoxyguanosinetriphosphate triphosphohydrolase [Deltaproteobacteria bacterium]
MLVREILEQQEKQTLHPRAMLSIDSRGREMGEPACDVRPIFQHDRDRVLHSKSFRRLMYKTQVLLLPKGDHYRTRLTHTLEVAQISRTIAKSLVLNESLTEAIALGHDLGHTPFGHAGEAVLNRLSPGGFRHYLQSLRVVEVLERDGRGLNLSFEVRDGIVKHSKGKGDILTTSPDVSAVTLEGRIVRIADIIAYINHDIDDAIRAGVIKDSDLPNGAVKVLGTTYSRRIDTMIKSVIAATQRADYDTIALSDDVLSALNTMRAFLFEAVYESEVVHGDFAKCERILSELFNHYMTHPDVFEREAGFNKSNDPIERRITDFIAGMTDRYALDRFNDIFMPKPWGSV